VALKLLPEYLKEDKERLGRFKQEARAASALNHPNIATIYEIGEVEGQNYIAMEYVDGQTLAAKINGRPLDPDQIPDIALQMADALEEAHAKGITHRDIKPDNIMLTSRGHVKVLDFGLAKVKSHEGQTLGSDLPTQAKTQSGVVIGTLAYMSPEQALGKAVDHRTDIFSLGAALYEMTTGRQPFSGVDAGETIDRILHAQPEAIARFNYDAPAELERIIRKCLEKDLDRRYQSARELVIDLRNLKRDLDSGTVPAEQAAQRRRRRGWQMAAGGLAVIIVAIAATLYARLGPGTAIESIAVLPFTNESGDPNMEYLSDGITESLINSFSQLPRFRVIARTTVFRFKGREVDPQRIGRELGVDGVLTGKMTQRGDNLIVQADLVAVADGSQLWGEQYSRKLADLLSLQQDIATNIAEKSRLRLTREEQKRLTKRYTENTEAYQRYLKGRYFLFKATEDGMNKGIEYFQEAIAIDPNYALAYAGLSDSYKALVGFTGFLSPREVSKVKAAAIRALEIDETLGEAHTSLAEYKLYFEWDWVGAEREYLRAIELNPNYPYAHQAYANYLEGLARLDEAIAERQRAAELDPLTPITVADVGYPFYYARQHDRAIEYFRRGLELDPNFFWGHLWIGQAYVEKKMYEEAIAEIQKAIGLSSGHARAIATLGYAYGVSGKRVEAQKVLDELKERSTRSYVSPYFIALIYTGLGENDQAFEWLEKAYNERHPYLTLIKVEPVFDSLRSDSRFADLLRRIGLKP
jgi:serine/threonine-protein kinase